MIVMENVSAVIKVAPELWATNIFPEGIIEKWLVPDDALVRQGGAVAVIRIEDTLHELIAPATGRLRTDATAGSIIDPGMAIGRILS
jgi:hypothetical protein